MLRRCLAVGVLASALTSATTPAYSTPAAKAPCAWAGESDQRDVNVGAPDLDAYYVSDEVPVSSRLRLQIRGAYPFARYFSFHIYNVNTLLPLGTIYDQQINPDPGSDNPYRRALQPGLGNTYTVYIVFANSPKHPAANTIYVNPRGLGPAAMLIYRIYVPTTPGNPSGGVAYPTVNILSQTGASTYASEPGCATVTPRGGSDVYKLAADSDYPGFLPSEHVAGAHRVPVWQRSFGSRLGNEQNAYLSTVISRQYGPLVVIHARVGTFPNNRAGQPVYGPHQLRYWSFCTYDAQGQAGYGCAADYAAAIRHGYVTYVISDPGARPNNATKKDGVTWLPWGGDQYSASIVERNMLPAASFRHAIEAVTQKGTSSDPRAVMGSYYPSAVYCTTARFARGGWRACFKHARLPS